MITSIYKRYKFISALIILIGIFFPAITHGQAVGQMTPMTATASPNHHTLESEKFAKPIRAKVGLYMWFIGAPYVSTSMYPIDFYVIFHCTPVCGNLNINIMNDTSFINGVAPLIEVVEATPDTRIYRVQGTLYAPFNMRNYPFDSHKLIVMVEDKNLNIEHLVYEVDPTTTGVQPNIDVTGFDVDPHWKAKVSAANYDIFGPSNTYSNYTFEVTLKRPFIAGLLKGIVPGIIILISGFLALQMRSDRIMERLTVSSAALVGMVIYHLDLISSVSPLGYLTYADMFMIINYVCLIFMVFETVLMMEFIALKRRRIVKKMYVLGVYTIPTLWAVLQTLCWYYYFVFSNATT